MTIKNDNHLLLVNRGWRFDEGDQRWVFPRNAASFPEWRVLSEPVDMLHKMAILLERGFQDAGKSWRRDSWVIAHSRVLLLKPTDLLKAVRLLQRSNTEGLH